MAIAFARMEIISTRDGGSAVGLSSYLNRDRKIQNSTGRQFDFTEKLADGPNEFVHSEFLAPERLNQKWTSSETLWNAAEAADLKKDGTIKANAQIAKHMVLALPADDGLSRKDTLELARKFAQEHFVKHGVAVEMVIHDKGDGNPHAHLLISTRTLGENGFGPKARHLNPGFAKGKHVLRKDAWGQEWANFQNGYFKFRGLDVEVDAVGKASQKHVGPVWHQKGEQAVKREINEGIRAENAELTPEEMLTQLTWNKSIFSERDIARLISKIADTPEENATRKDELLSQETLVSLYDHESGKFAGFTTREVLEQEKRVIDMARARSQDIEPPPRPEAVQRALLSRTMDPEQEQAFRHAIAPGGLKIIEGRAGSGKSYTMGAIREAYEKSGFRVVGLSPTNTVAQDMKKDGFAEAGTAHSAVWHQEKNARAEKWGKKTVLLVDEAAMLDTEIMEKVLANADRAGAKMILVGDDRQLASIARGGMFTEFRHKFGSAEITKVRRQEADWQKEASANFSEGQFLDGLKRYQERKGFLHWLPDAASQKEVLVREWTKDMSRDPAQARFVYAGTNAEVNELNMRLRDILAKRGDVIGNHEFETCKGTQAFGVGDRIQFHGTNKQTGIFNGSLGTIKWIDGDKVHVLTDAGNEVAFNAKEFKDFALGYAGTVYRGQGKTQTTVYCLHGRNWESRTSYVGLTRHKERLKFFIDQSHTKDLRVLAIQMGQKRVARASIGFRPEFTVKRVLQKERVRTKTRDFDIGF
ncbi:AAA family ATPase [Desulfolutivibrio sp.]|uniref:AAA family ATPase n=1 Tax=Desulfolutivibrio sp. TaxID=2773296 RepID=UPI002F9651AA